MRTFEQFLESAMKIAQAVPDAPLPNTAQPTPTMRLAPPPAQKILPDDYKFKEKKVRRLLRQVPGGSVKKGVFTPTRNLEVPRAEMPQLKSREDFIHWIQGEGVKVEIKQVTPRSLIRKNGQKLTAHAQSNIYIDKAMKFIRKNNLLHKLIILTRDGIIFDGNHHWFALMAVAPRTPVPMYVVDMDFQPLKQFTCKSYPDVTFEEQWNEFLDDFAYNMYLSEADYYESTSSS